MTSIPRLQAQTPAKKAEGVQPTPEQRAPVRTSIEEGEAALRRMRADREVSPDHDADARVFVRAASLMDELREYARPGDPKMLVELTQLGRRRAMTLGMGGAPWTRGRGSVVRGYKSRLDGSAQAYVVEVPSGLDLSRPARLDVVLHGRNDGMNEARFIQSHFRDEVPADRSYLTLHVFGRGNNAYRWAGEADVFEAIEAVRRNYKVDDDRVVLRGFSMGGAGAWHIGLHYPSLWCSVEAGAGFTETLRYAKLQGQPLPEWRRKALAIYDSVDYARNAHDVPIIGYGGEDDPQLQASTNIIDALKAERVPFHVDGLVTTAEGLDFRRVVGRGVGHRVDPESQSLLDAFHGQHAKTGLDRTPTRIRFVTATLAYNTAHWITVERLGEHYRRASVDADLAGDVATIRTANVTAIGVDRQVAETVRLDGVELPLRPAAKGLLPKVYYRKGAEGWEVLAHEASLALVENVDRQKAPGVQGPIDDAFHRPFLVVEPTGKPWHPEAAAWAKSRLDRFSNDWRRRFRGEVRSRRDTEVTEDDIASYSLVLFGDPGSNAVLGRIVDDLPLGWSRERFTIGGEYEARGHAVAFVAPNPLNPKRYVVINSGMTFEPSDFAGTNALLFPRLGDYAIFRLGPGLGEVVTSGYFDERWRVRR